MTEKEMDLFFMDALKKFLKETEDCAEYIKGIKGRDYDEIRAEYEYVIADLQDLLDNIRTLEDLAQMDEETIGAVFDYIQEYADNFVISNEAEQQKKDLEEYAKIEEILDLFFDEDEE